MKRRVRLIVLPCCLTAALLAYPVWQKLTEPRYKCRPARYWFKAFCDIRTNSFISGPNGRHRVFSINGTEVPDIGGDALHAMGEPAVAFLVKRITSPSLFDIPGYAFVYTNLPMSVRQRLSTSDEREYERMQAVLALASMGKGAEPAIPTIIDYALKRPGAVTAIVASEFQVPPSEMNRLLNSLAQQGRYGDIRAVINQRLVRSPVAAGLVAEILAKDKTGDIWPLQTLREIGPDSAVAVPVLLGNITSTNFEVRYQTARTLEAIGPGAVAALPALKACMEEGNSMVQSAARRAIQAITEQSPKEPGK
jgi:hypothetical protein